MTAERVREVAAHHRAALIALSHEWASDQIAVTGLARGVAALDRVLRACDGESDPVRLGLTAAPPDLPEPAGLFGDDPALAGRPVDVVETVGERL